MKRSSAELPAKNYIQDALGIVKIAKDKHLTLRILGAIAVSIHCPKHVGLYQALDRKMKDIDLAGLSKERPDVETLLQSLGYETHPILSQDMLFQSNRDIFYNPKDKQTVDIFFDKLDMNHTIDFRKRLTRALDYPTISLTDILLVKMQIVMLTDKDVKDAIVLLLEHDVGQTDKEEVINAEYIADLLSKDWGFWYTFTTNLNRVTKSLSQYPVLIEAQRENIHKKIEDILRIIDKKPKSLKWKVRAQIGTRMEWYKKVDEVSR